MGLDRGIACGVVKTRSLCSSIDTEIQYIFLFAHHNNSRLGIATVDPPSVLRVTRDFLSPQRLVVAYLFRPDPTRRLPLTLLLTSRTVPPAPRREAGTPISEARIAIRSAVMSPPAILLAWAGAAGFSAAGYANGGWAKVGKNLHIQRMARSC